MFGSVLSRGLVYSISGFYIRDFFKQMMDNIKQLKFELMDPMHHLLSGFKALCTDEVIKIIDESRRACGGAGFASFSGFTDQF